LKDQEKNHPASKLEPDCLWLCYCSKNFFFGQDIDQLREQGTPVSFESQSMTPYRDDPIAFTIYQKVMMGLLT